MLPEAHETTIDGVPAFWTTIDQAPQVTMTFGVGMRDEPPNLSGVTHLVEHLVFSSIAPLATIHNGSARPTVLTLEASGAPADLTHFVHAVTSAIRSLEDLPESELVREKKVLQAETTFRYARPACSLLAYRFGYTGIGKSSAGAVALPALTLDEVVSWARAHLTKDNLVLTFVGPPPDGISIDLPERVSEPARPVEIDAITTPTVVPSSRHSLGFSVVAPPPIASLLASVLEHEIMSELRQQHGLIYSTDLYLTDIDEARTAIDVFLDPLDEQVIPALEALLALLARLREHGVGDDAVDYARRSLDDAAQNYAAAASHLLDGLARAHFTSSPADTPQRALAFAETATPASLTDALRAALTGLLLAVDDDQDLPEGLAERRDVTIDAFDLWRESAAEPVGRTTRWRARRRGDTPGIRLTLDDSSVRLSHRKAGYEVGLDSLTFVSYSEDGWIGLLDHRGRSGGIDMTDYRKGSTIIDALAARLPAGVVRALPPR